MAETFAEADRVMTPLLGKPLTEFIFVDQSNANAVAKAEDDLRQTAITQPAVLATDRVTDPAARRLRHSARHDDGTQPGRVRSAGCVRRASLSGRTGGGQRPRPRDDQRGDEGQRPHGGSLCAARRNRAHPQDRSTAMW